MFDLVEIELTRVRKMAEHTRDEFLLYLIDIAIIEANAKARSQKDSRDDGSLERTHSGFASKTAPELQVVR